MITTDYLLEQKYNEHFITGRRQMTEKEAREYLDDLRRDTTNEYRDHRIARLERYIDGIERSRASKSEREQRNIELAKKCAEITEKWTAAGAYWKPIGSSGAKWYYGDTPFMTWFSGKNVVDMYPEYVKADAAFERLVTNGVIDD